MTDVVWMVTQCDYLNDDESPGQGKVRATTLHWRTSLIEGEYEAGSYGSESVTDQNRQYTLPALEAVPMHVMVGWLHDAMGDEEVAAIEQALRDNIYKQEFPPGGYVIPSDAVEVTPV